MSIQTQLANLIERIDRGNDAEQAREEVAALLKDIEPEELVRIEQELVARGLPTDKMRHLCGPHMGACAGQRDEFRDQLPAGHVLATLMDEHAHILAKLDQLDQLVGEDEPWDAARFEEIAGVGDFLVGVEPHHQREEQVLFPLLIDRGLSGPPRVMAAEHVELRELKHAVRDGARSAVEHGAADESTVRGSARRLIGMLRDHIFKEDTILYPMALQGVSDPAVWAEARRRCDEIGYCCHHPSG